MSSNSEISKLDWDSAAPFAFSDLFDIKLDRNIVLNLIFFLSLLHCLKVKQKLSCGWWIILWQSQWTLYYTELTCSKLVALSKYVTLMLAPAGEWDRSTWISSCSFIHQSSFWAGELKIQQEIVNCYILCWDWIIFLCGRYKVSLPLYRGKM